MAGRVAGVDQEIAVHFRDLRAADAQAPAAGGVDQLPGAVARRILEGRAAGLFADRLRGLAMVLHLVHPRADRLRRGDQPAKARRGENDGRIDAAVAIDEFHVGIVEADASCRRGRCLVASISTSLVSAPLAPAFMRSAPPMVPGMPKKNSRPPILAAAAVSATRLSSAAAPALTISPSALVSPKPRGDSLITTPGNAAVAHDQVGADADDIDRKFGRQMREEISEVIFIRRREQHLRRAADPKPGQLRQRLVRQQPPAQLRHRGFEIGRDVGEGHVLMGNSVAARDGRPSPPCGGELERGVPPELQPLRPTPPPLTLPRRGGGDGESQRGHDKGSNL